MTKTPMLPSQNKQKMKRLRGIQFHQQINQ